MAICYVRLHMLTHYCAACAALHGCDLLQGVSSATRKFRSKLVVKRFEELAASGAAKLAQSPVSICTIHIAHHAVLHSSITAAV
jgi:hypothetical protein